MSLTVQQILTDAKKLVNRLKEHDSTADNLLSQAQVLNKKVDAMKQYHEDVTELNNVARQRPRSALVLGIQHENRHLRELQQENKELRTLLEEHQSALELIMSKYRQHVVQLLSTGKAEKRCMKGCNHNQLLQDRADKICEMAAVMNKAISVDDNCVAKEQEKIKQLVTENQGLRELLEISVRLGSRTTSLHRATETEDREIQTES